MVPSHPPCWWLLLQHILLPKCIWILALLIYSAGGGRGKDWKEFIFQLPFFPAAQSTIWALERDCVSAPNTWLHVCFVSKKGGMKQGYAVPLTPGMGTRCVLVFPQTDRGTTAASGWFSKHSTRDRFWHELILPRLDKTLSWLFLLLCYLCYPKIWASKNVSPGTCGVVPFSQEYSQRTSSRPPLLQAFHSKYIVYGAKLQLWKINEVDLHIWISGMTCLQRWLCFPFFCSSNMFTQQQCWACFKM